MHNKNMILKSLAIAFLITLCTATIESSEMDADIKNIDSGLKPKVAELKTGEKTLIEQIEERYREFHKKQESNSDEEDEKAEDQNQNREEDQKKIWLLQNKSKIINFLLIVIGFVLFVLIGIRYYSITQSIKIQAAEIEDYAKQLEQIIEGTDKLVFMTWKDQKEGLIFVDNPSYKKKSNGDLTKVQQIEAEIEKVESDIDKKGKEIDNLRDRELYYINEIEKLERELEAARELILDEGAALGYAETVIKEFK